MKKNSLVQKIRNFKVNLDFCTKLLLATSFMSVCDALFTLAWIKFGIANEANPILDYALQLSDLHFLSAKISLTFLGCFLLFRVRHYKLAKNTIIFISFVYFMLTLYHLVGASLSIDYEDLQNDIQYVFTSAKSQLGLLD